MTTSKKENVKVENITGNARQNFLQENNGKEMTDGKLLTSLRAVNLVDGQPKLKMKVFAWLSGQVNVSGKKPMKGKIEYQGIAKDPSRKNANLTLGLSKAQISELKDISTASIHG